MSENFFNKREVFIGKNTSSNFIEKKKLVYIDTWDNNVPVISLASALSNKAVGITLEKIEAGKFGQILVLGKIDLDNALSLYNEGDVLYLSNTSGEITTTSPSNVQVVGNIIKSYGNYVEAFVDFKELVAVSYTDEDAQDAIGAMIDATLIYDDAAPSLGIDLTNPNTWTGLQTFEGGVELGTDIGLSIIPASDVRTWAPDNISFSVTLDETSPTSVFFDPTGTYMYITGVLNDDFIQYTLSTPWNITTATLTTTGIATGENNPNGIWISPDGVYLYVTGTSNDRIRQFTMSTPWMISTATFTGQSASFSAQEPSSSDVVISNDGTQGWIVGTANDAIHHFTMSTPWDATTFVYSGTSTPNLSTTYGLSTITSMQFSSDGTNLYLLDNTIDRIYQFELSTPYDITTISYNNKSVATDYTNGENAASGFFISESEGKVFIIGTSQDRVEQWTMADALLFEGEGQSYFDGGLTIGKTLSVRGGGLNVEGNINASVTITGATLTAVGAITNANNSLGSNTTNLHTTTSSATANIASGATVAANTKTINFGANGLSGSTTIINIGSSVAGAITTGTVYGSFTFNSDVLVPDEVYGSGWNGSLEVPTKNAVYDKIETIASSISNPSYVAKSTNYTLTSSDYTVDATASLTFTLLTSVGLTGKIFNLCNSSGTTITIDTTSSQTIYLPGGAVTSVILNDGESLTVQSTGSNWRAL